MIQEILMVEKILKEKIINKTIKEKFYHGIKLIHLKKKMIVEREMT